MEGGKIKGLPTDEHLASGFLLRRGCIIQSGISGLLGHHGTISGDVITETVDAGKVQGVSQLVHQGGREVIELIVQQ
jgi:hypothetical protein